MESSSSTQPASPSLTRGRLCIFLGTLLWSLGGGFAKVLTLPTFLHLNEPRVVDAASMAFYRILFAGLVLVPALRRSDISFRPMMLVMALSFAGMNGLYVYALTKGPAANAVLMQYTAPMWVYVASVLWLGEPADRRGVLALLMGLFGIGVILYGGWADTEQLGVIACALGSGVAYAGVILCLRVLRDSSPRWLTVLNHLCGALFVIPFVWSAAAPTWPQLVFLCVFGVVQMAVPYWLVTYGMRTVSSQEASMIMLLEPLLNPVWAYVLAKEEPPRMTVLGAVFILGGLIWRFWPRGKGKANATGKIGG